MTGVKWVRTRTREGRSCATTIPNSKERGNKTSARFCRKTNNGTLITRQRRVVRTTPRTDNTICTIPAPAASHRPDHRGRPASVLQVYVSVRQHGYRRTLYLLKRSFLPPLLSHYWRFSACLPDPKQVQR